MATPISPQLLREFDAICDQLEQAWKVDHAPPVESFVKDSMPAPERNELLRQLLEVEFEQRLVRNDTPQLEDYLVRFPELESWIAERLRSLHNTTFEPHGRHGSTSRGNESKDPMLGRQLGKYLLTEKLGEGGMGTVYRVRHTMIACERALKLLRSNLVGHPQALERFLIEAQACVNLSHAHIVNTYDVNQEDDGTIYLVMELLNGENLAELVTRKGPLSFRQAATIAAQAASGLEYVHQQGTVHRDIKPHNIMWTTSGVTKILDLGLARMLDERWEPPCEPSAAVGDLFDVQLSYFQSRLTNRLALLGTLPYMSPEQAANAREADRQSDIYSLGCTFYFLLTGHHAFSADSPEVILRKHLEADHVPARELRADLPRPLEKILARMMHPQPERRYASAADAEADLQDWLQRGRRSSTGRQANVKPLDLQDPEALHRQLLQLQIVSEADWHTAELGIASSRADWHTGYGTRSVASGAARSVLILQELQRLRNQRDGKERGLSQFQVSHLLNGNVDLLRLPQHVLLDQVGHGWKGDVFRGRHIEMDRIEAIRTFDPRALEGLAGTGRKRIAAFHQAVECLMTLDHASLPKCYGSDGFNSRLLGETVMLASYFAEGVSIADVVSRGQRPDGQPADPRWGLSVIRDACRALAVAHRSDVLHLDLHALAVMIDHSENVWVLDVGIAPLLTRKPLREKTGQSTRRLRSAISDLADMCQETVVRAPMSTVAPPPVGTPHIMPPEQWQNRAEVSVATDIYNLGCTLFFVLTGQYPFSGSNALELMQQHLSQPPLSSPAAGRIPAFIHPVLEGALAKKPHDRYRSADEMADALDKLLN